MITMFNAFLNKPAPSQSVFCFDSLEKKKTMNIICLPSFVGFCFLATLANTNV